jgi:hypothetical protein
LTNWTPTGAQEFYKGKTLSIMVGTAAGGGIDTIARLFARHFGKHIEGSPSIVVQNMPGAAGLVAMNHVAQRAPKDGTTIIYDVWTPLSQVIKAKQIRFDYREMTTIGALHGGPWLMFARKTALPPGGLSSRADLEKIKGIVYAGQQPTLILDIHGRLALNILKVDYKYVSGYKGARDIRLAIERDEAHVTTHGLQGYRGGVEPRLVKDGVVVPLWYFQRRDSSGAYVDSPLVKDMPAFLDVYRKIYGTNPSGIAWEALDFLAALFGRASNVVWGPPGMDPNAVRPLQKAFHATFADPDFIADQKKMFGFQYKEVNSEEVAKVTALLNSVDPKLVAYFQKLMTK